MNNVDQISAKIELLRDTLKKNGKLGPAEFYDSLGKKIGNAPDILGIKKILLDDVKKSEAITQYADFSADEEKIFNEV